MRIPPREAQVLALLRDADGKVVTLSHIANEIYGENIVDYYVRKRIRLIKFRLVECGFEVETVKGVGLRLVTDRDCPACGRPL